MNINKLPDALIHGITIREKKYYWFTTLVLIILSLPILCQAQGACYVDDQGNDLNPGTYQYPFRTIQHAADIMGQNSITTAFVFPGLYKEQVIISNSGTAADPLVFTRLSNTVPAPVISGRYTDFIRDIESFEYDSNNALSNAWVSPDGEDPGITCTTLFRIAGTNSMQWEYTCSNLTPSGYQESLIYTFPVTQDWSAYKYFIVTYRANTNNSDEFFFFQLQDMDGTAIGTTNAGWPIINQDNDWHEWEIDISGWSNGWGLGQVNRIKMQISPANYGNGVMYFDQFYLRTGNNLKTNNYAIEINQADYIHINGFTCQNTLQDAIILLNGSSYCHIQNNDCISNELSGITLYSNTSYNLIENNICHSYYYSASKGIFLENAGNNIIRSNHCSFNNNGIKLVKTSINNDLTNNNICTNKSDGIYLVDNCSNNIIAYNLIITNEARGIYLQNDCNNNIINSNLIYRNWYEGIVIEQSSINFISNNICRQNLSTDTNFAGGILITGSSSVNNLLFNNNCHLNYYGINLFETGQNTLYGNNCSYNNKGMILHNNTQQITVISNICRNNQNEGIDSAGNSQHIIYNTCYSNARGITISFGQQTNAFNLCYGNTYEGIYIYQNVYNTLIKNCTLFANQADGIHQEQENGANIFIRNCISAYNQGWGFNGASNVSYSDAFANTAGEYELPEKQGCMQLLPCFTNTDPYAGNYLNLKSGSPCIDAADPDDDSTGYSGFHWDMGAFESVFQADTDLAINKQIIDIKLKGLNYFSIPGSTITYYLSYSNIGSQIGFNIICYDRIPVQACYETQELLQTGWDIEWSTNSDPLQDFLSDDYTNIRPAQKQEIKWIRWKKTSFLPAEELTLNYKVTIK